MHEPCRAEVFPPSAGDECNRFVSRSVPALIIYLLFSCLPAIRCRLNQLLFRIRYCARGNADGTIDVLADPNEWLADHQSVAQAIIWWRMDGTPHPYLSWTNDEKHDLYTAFWRARMDEDTGIPEAPPEATPETVGRSVGTYFPPDQAWTLFVAHVAQSLAVEEAGWAPWSITSFTVDQLSVLFNSLEFFSPDSRVGRYDVYEDMSGWTTPGDPVRTFRFLRRNSMIGATTRQTVENLLEWCRANMDHFGGFIDIPNLIDYWQYSGYPPVERVIAGTIYAVDRRFSHYTAGCWGTDGFLRFVLRTVNIPVKHELRCATSGTGRHSGAAFLRDGLHLPHGDDPYDRLAFFNPRRPVGELLIDEATHTSWFGPGVPGDVACNNVFRHIVELAVASPTANALLRVRCDDIAAGRSNDNGNVFVRGPFSLFYTVAELESAGFWTRLDEEIQRRGGCANIPP